MNLKEFQIIDPEMVSCGPEIQTVSLESLIERVDSFLGFFDQLGALKEPIEAQELETKDQGLWFSRVMRMMMGVVMRREGGLGGGVVGVGMGGLGGH